MGRIVLCLLLGAAVASPATVSELYRRGFNVLPQPQVATLSQAQFTFSSNWKLELQGVPAKDISVTTLQEQLTLQLPGRPAEGTLRLVIAPNAARVGIAQDADKAALARQAYKIILNPKQITIAANDLPGLFYGVVTFTQIINSKLQLPEGTIEDWPDLQLRQIFWDDSHHLDKLDTLKQTIRQAALFKINGFALKLEAHFQFANAATLVEPHAMTPAQFQELTDYALKYHVQLIPFLDAPGHIAFILKHPAYAALRAFPESNYELCVTNPDSYKLLEGMFQNLLDANRGGKYFYLSTDEPYYIGLAKNSACTEADRAKQLGSVGKLLAEFITKTAGYLHDRGRTVLFWGEYPLKPDDIASLPKHIVNGEVYGPQFDPLFRKHGIREMIYTSTQGEEKLFPEYFPLPAAMRIHPEREGGRRVSEMFHKLSFDSARRDADLMGSMVAAWADAGLHPETFWLGYATGSAYGWHPNSPDPAEAMSSFYRIFYGPRVINMDRTYQLMSTQAQFWSDSWETVQSKERTPIWGNSNQIFNPRRPAKDQSLPLPPVPDRNLVFNSDWQLKNAKRLLLAGTFLADNDELLGLLHRNLQLADSNNYNLEVFLSIAQLYRQNLEMIQNISKIDGLLRSAGDAAGKNPSQALASVDQVLELANIIRYSRNRTLADTTETWYKSWLPREAEANGRRFLHQFDDVKDHLPDRTVDMTYLIHRQLLLEFGEWVESIRTARNQFSETHKLAPNNQRFDWKNLKPVLGPAVGTITLE